MSSDVRNALIGLIAGLLVGWIIAWLLGVIIALAILLIRRFPELGYFFLCVVGLSSIFGIAFGGLVWFASGDAPVTLPLGFVGPTGVVLFALFCAAALWIQVRLIIYIVSRIRG